MAIETRVQYALNNFLRPEYFDSQKERYELLETEKQGKARIILNVGTIDNICVKNYDKMPDWEILRKERKFHMRKGIDHFILIKKSDFWELHMIEVKKTVSNEVWRNIKCQISASYLTIKSLLTFLGISVNDENVFIYTAYGEEKMVIGDSATEGVTTKTFKTGEKLKNSKIEEWDANCIPISMIDSEGIVYEKNFNHTKVKMTIADDGFLEQKFTLPI